MWSESISISFFGEEKLELGKKWLEQKKKKPLLISGVTSSGKTTFIRTLLDKYMIVEINEFNELEMELNRKSLAKIAIVAECLESLHDSDLKKIEDICTKKWSIPFILTVDDAYEKNFKFLRNNCEWIILKKISNADAVNMLDAFLFQKDIQFKKDTLEYILEMANYNIRQALNLLQFYNEKDEKQIISNENISSMDVKNDLFNEVSKICSGSFNKENIFQSYEEIKYMLHENASSNATTIMNSSKICDTLSINEVFEKNDVKEEYCNYLLQSSCSEQLKGFKKVHKLRFPSLYLQNSIIVSNFKSKKIKIEYKNEKMYENNFISLTNIYDTYETLFVINNKK